MFLEFGSSKPHFTAVENGKIGVTVRKENGDGSMGYIVVNSNSTMNFDAENYSIVIELNIFKRIFLFLFFILVL